MVAERIEQPNLGAPPPSHQENIVVLKYGPDVISELGQLSESKRLFDAVIIDAIDYGFLFTAETMIDAARLAKHMLQLQGALIFLKADKAVGFVRQSLMGDLFFLGFESYAELFDYSPTLASHVQVALGKSNDVLDESTDLAQQVLLSTVPVLTDAGIKLKGAIDASNRRNAVLAAIDNFTPVSTIAQRFIEKGRMTQTELLQELKGLETAKAIFPIFPKVPFLVNCFRNRAAFSLSDYLVAARLVNRADVDQMQAEMRNTLTDERFTLGPLALKKGFINARQLEITMQDQAFYGQAAERNQLKLVKSTGEEAQVQSLLGHLGTVDPSNLLQNLAQNRESGVLSVEYKDMQFRAMFETGKLTHAKVSKIVGNQAVIEFASSWRAGIFVFMKRTPPADLAKDNCKLTKMLDKLLLDAALATDNMDVALKKLPKALDTVLEKNEDSENLLERGDFEDPQEKYKLDAAEVEIMKRLWNDLDGLATLGNTIKRLQDVPTHKGTRAADLLRHYGLVSLPEMGVHAPLAKFNQMCRKVADKIGVERSIAFLRLSMRDTVGYSVRARMFALGSSGEVGIDMAAARNTGASLSLVIKDVENWQVKYIEYVSQEIDSEILLSIIHEIHQEEVEAQSAN
jgi:hypothetical protein